MAKGKTTVCIVGTGMIAGVHAAGYAELDNVILKVHDIDIVKATKFAANYDNVEVVEALDSVFSRKDIDGLDICLTHDLHLEICEKAFAAGKHVLLEKPMANTLEEADKMIAAADKAGKVLAVSENFRFEPAILKAKEIMDAGDIGKPFMIVVNDLYWMAEITTVNPAYDWRRKLEDNAGGVLYDRGVHLAATINYLGGPAETVYARCMNPQKYWEGDETSIMTVTHKNGIVSNYISSWNILGHPWRETPLFAIFGTEGSIVENGKVRIGGHYFYEAGGLKITSRKNKKYPGRVINNEFLAGKTWLEDIWHQEVPNNMLEDMVRRGNEWFVEDEYPDYDVYHASVNDFVKAVKGEKAPHVSGKDARGDVAVVFAAYESDKTNSVVKL
ncbi:MAG: hypothetical protein DRP56_04050 [Planctomycetota bacterium]|nr:MAG: hypothetical protein DRP56_04050 [Planctomycetota bacterium]